MVARGINHKVIKDCVNFEFTGSIAFLKNDTKSAAVESGVCLQTPDSYPMFWEIQVLFGQMERHKRTQRKMC